VIVVKAIAVLGPIWLVLGIVIIVCALRAGRSERALRIGCFAASALWVLGGGLVHAAYLLAGSSYSGFADAAYISFVRETWESLVVPNQTIFIGLLAAFEATMGLLVLIRGWVRQAALLALIAFNVLLISFGWAYYLWALPIAGALALLLRAERRRTAAGGPTPITSVVGSGTV
jgi:hypothetical protein